MVLKRPGERRLALERDPRTRTRTLRSSLPTEPRSRRTGCTSPAAPCVPGLRAWGPWKASPCGTYLKRCRWTSPPAGKGGSSSRGVSGAPQDRPTASREPASAGGQRCLETAGGPPRAGWGAAVCAPACSRAGPPGLGAAVPQPGVRCPHAPPARSPAGSPRPRRGSQCAGG